MARLYGTVRFRLVPAYKLPSGPVFAYVDRARAIRWAIDEAQMDPILASTFANVGMALSCVIPALRPTLIRVDLDRSLGGSQLYAAELDGSCLRARVPHELMTQDVAREISRHSTLVLRNLLDMPPAA